jgi:hypothetical protein
VNPGSSKQLREYFELDGREDWPKTPAGAPTAFFSVVDPRRMICVHNLRRLVCSTARTCMAGMGQCHRNPL